MYNKKTGESIDENQYFSFEIKQHNTTWLEGNLYFNNEI
jgi:hypothetical protein